MFKGILVLSVFLYIKVYGESIPNTDDIISMIKEDGYPVELYEVTTKDNYILNLYRIPQKSRTSKVVFAMHGMLVSSADFLVLGNGTNKALAYSLSDAGYDVWLGNARGTRYSKKHVRLSATDDEFWQFSWHEIGNYDLPAFIDTVLLKTEQKSLHFIGHSQGTTTFFVMLSNYPAYNEKIRSFHGMTPVMVIKHPSPLGQLLAANVDEMEQALTMFNIHEFPTGMTEIQNVAGMFCKDGMPFTTLCGNLIFAVFGKNRDQFNGTMLGPVMKYTPAGMSFRQLYHFLQLIISGKFQLYDYKDEGNLAKYKQSTPPEYKTENIKVKMQILFGTHDLMIQTEDVENLIHHFGTQVIDVVRLDNWNHIDFLYAKDANKMVYQKIIESMRKYEL